MRALKLVSMRRSFVAAVLFGLVMPFPVLPLLSGESWISSHFVLGYIEGAVVISFVVYWLFFLSFFKSYKCPKCFLSWAYKRVDNDMIDKIRSVMEIRLYKKIFIYYGLEIHLTEYQCSMCQYNSVIKSKKPFIEFGVSE